MNKQLKENPIMNYNAFINFIKENILSYLPSEYAPSSVALSKVTKNNESLNSLTVSSPASNVSPTIYLNGFFEQYEAGTDIKEILSQISKMRVMHEMNSDFDVSSITDFDCVRDQILPRLYGTQSNAELLADRPHRLMDDLAITYCVTLGDRPDGFMSIPITNDLLNSWNTDEETLFLLAITNLPTIAPSTFKSMTEVMCEMMPELFASDDELCDSFLPMNDMDDKMFVLSNKQNVNGASALLDNTMMDAICEKIGSNFFILPSSLHEVLIVPASKNMDLSELEDMVREVNATQVAPPDKLSDSVYRYDREHRTIKLAVA